MNEEEIFRDKTQMPGKAKCPFVCMPHADCYCGNLNSQNIEKALYFCIEENFKQCRIYKAMSDETGY